jgi:hypothetical protein
MLDRLRQSQRLWIVALRQQEDLVQLPLLARVCRVVEHPIDDVGDLELERRSRLAQRRRVERYALQLEVCGDLFAAVCAERSPRR